MIQCIAFAIFYLLILKFAETLLLRNVETALVMKEYNKIRRRFTLLRWGSFLAFYVLLYAYMIWVARIFPYEISLSAYLLMIGFPYFVYYYSERNVLERYIIKGGKEIICREDECSLLLLRPFDKDDYTPGQEVDTWLAFSERALLMWLKPYMELYAIGKPGELSTPSGAKRIYVEHANWKDDVGSMMKRCNILLMLLSDSESCLWELEKAQEFQGKLIIIVDNLSVYESTRFKLKGKLELPEVKADAEFPMLLCPNGCRYQFLHFSYTKHSYRLLADAVLESLSGIRKKRAYVLLQYIQWHLLPIWISSVFMLVLGWLAWPLKNPILSYVILGFFLMSSTLVLWCFAVVHNRKQRFRRDAKREKKSATIYSLFDALRHCNFSVLPKNKGISDVIRRKIAMVWSRCWRIFAVIIFLSLSITQIIQLLDFFRIREQAKQWEKLPVSVHVDSISGPFSSDAVIYYTYCYGGKTYDKQNTYNNTAFIYYHKLRDKTLPITVKDICYVNPLNPDEDILESDLFWPVYEKISFTLCLLSTLVIVPWCIVTLRFPRKHFM